MCLSHCFKRNLAWTAPRRPLLHVIVFAGEHFFPSRNTRQGRLLPLWSGLFFVIATRHRMLLLRDIYFLSCALIHDNINTQTIEIVAFPLCVSIASWGRLGLRLWWREKAIFAATEHLQQLAFSAYDFKCHVGCFLKIVWGKKRNVWKSNYVSRQLKIWAAFSPPWFCTRSFVVLNHFACSSRVILRY